MFAAYTQRISTASSRTDEKLATDATSAIMPTQQSAERKEIRNVPSF
jgi:hypothetical protein